MCGIAGLVHLSFEQSPLNVRAISANIARQLAHRGPDHIGTYSNGFLAISHARLSIRDLTSRSNQPYISSHTGSILSYNGEIYNTSELYHCLDKHYQRTVDIKSDTSVLSALLDNFGLDFLDSIKGTYAFSWFDSNTDSLYLVRDRLGVKPLYYTIVDHHLIFASEVSVLKQFTDNSFDDQSFSEYLWFGNRISASNTFYKNIYSIESAGVLKVTKSNYSHYRWWKPDHWMYKSIASADIPAIFDNSVTSQLVSDVPACLLLSGGIDSSFVASYLKDTDITAVYADFGNDYSSKESQRAKFVANEYSIPFESVSVCPNVDVFGQIQSYFGEPFADPATIPLNCIYKSLADRFRVCIQGDGGDELFSGYSRHKFLRYKSVISSIARACSNISPSFLPMRVNRLINLYSMRYGHDMYSSLMTVHTSNFSPFHLLDVDYAQYISSSTDFTIEFRKIFEKYSYCSPLFIGMLCDILIQLPAQFFPKVDITSMANSIEARVPLADDDLLRLALNLRDSDRVKWLRGKATIRSVFERRASNKMCRKIVKQKKKGFNTPFSSWLQKQLLGDFKERLLSPDFSSKFNFDNRALNSFVERHTNQHCKSSPSEQFTAFQLFCLSFHI